MSLATFADGALAITWRSVFEPLLVIWLTPGFCGFTGLEASHLAGRSALGELAAMPFLDTLDTPGFCVADTVEIVHLAFAASLDLLLAGRLRGRGFLFLAMMILLHWSLSRVRHLSWGGTRRLADHVGLRTLRRAGRRPGGAPGVRRRGAPPGAPGGAPGAPGAPPGPPCGHRLDLFVGRDDVLAVQADAVGDRAQHVGAAARRR